VEFFLQTFDLWAFAGLLGLGFVVGRANERRHYAHIHRREDELPPVPVITMRTVDDPRPVASVELATGSVVVAIDAYKRFQMSLRNFVGGEARSYSSLIDRARREAVLRMRESAGDADLFANFRIQTATLFGGRGSNPSSVEVIAYATAIRFEKA
jgi:uncharacterized protein YbjQ (UPF0145 family)